MELENQQTYATRENKYPDYGYIERCECHYCGALVEETEEYCEQCKDTLDKGEDDA